MDDLPVASGWYYLEGSHVSGWYRYYELETGVQHVVAFISDESYDYFKDGEIINLKKYMCAYRKDIPSDEDHELTELYVSDDSLETVKFDMDVALAAAGWYVLPGFDPEF